MKALRFGPTKLLGLALGISPSELGIEALAVSANSLFGEVGIDEAAATGWTP